MSRRICETRESPPTGKGTASAVPLATIQLRFVILSEAKNLCILLGAEELHRSFAQKTRSG
jgi:hypothetical protein